MRNFWTWLKGKKSLGKLPDFPPKKAFGNKEREFLHWRQNELQYFFNTLLEIKGILDEIEVFKYFKEKCDKSNLDKLEEIIDCYKGRGREEKKEIP